VVEVLKFLHESISFSIEGLPVFVVVLHLDIFGMDLAIEALSVFFTNLSVFLGAFILAALLVENGGILVLPVEPQVAFHIVERWVREFYENRCTFCASAGKCRSYLGTSTSTIFIYPL
jgi:hypothetical protein